MHRIAERTRRDGDCLLWTGCTNRGYPVMRLNGKQQYVHRLVAFGGEPPPGHGQEVHHRCQNKRCVNRDHLEIVTPKQHVSKHVHGRIQDVCKKGLHSLDDAYWSGGKRRCRPCKIEYERNRNLESQVA